jgi:hypothetical protein
MLLKAKCSICNKEGLFDISNMKRTEVEPILAAKKSFNCSFGNHFENMSPISFMTFDWDNLIEGEAPSEEDFLKELKSQYTEVYTKEELENKYVIDGFLYGQCLVHSLNNEDDLKVFNFVESPKGTRYYIHREE